MVNETASIDEAMSGRVPPGSDLLFELDPRTGEKTIPYIIYKRFFVIFVLRRRSRAIITHLGWIEYTLKGDSGPVLLYIHGSPGGYDQTIDPGENYRVLSPSRPGYLGTQIFAGRSPEEQAECFKALIDALNIDKVIVMGVSGGGPSSMHFAAKYPQNTFPIREGKIVPRLFRRSRLPSGCGPIWYLLHHSKNQGAWSCWVNCPFFGGHHQ